MAKRIKKLEGGDIVLMKDGTHQYITFGEFDDDDYIIHQGPESSGFNPATRTPKAEFFNKAVKITSRSSYSKR